MAVYSAALCVMCKNNVMGKIDLALFFIKCCVNWPLPLRHVAVVITRDTMGVVTW